MDKTLINHIEYLKRQFNGTERFIGTKLIIDVSKRNGFWKRIKEIFKFIFTGKMEFELWKN